MNTYLRAGGHQIILSFTNVRELAGPLAPRQDFLRIRMLLQSLERLPHTYIREVSIIAQEIQSALDAFNNGTECQSCSVYVNRWDETFTFPGQRAPAHNLVNLRLDEIVYDIFRNRPDVFGPPPEHHLGTFRANLDRDRPLLRAGRLPAREHFIVVIRNHTARWRLPSPHGREHEFAEWIYANPNRCPGLRLQHQPIES
jgi:hypothetical protein